MACSRWDKHPAFLCAYSIIQCFASRFFALPLLVQALLRQCRAGLSYALAFQGLACAMQTPAGQRLCLASRFLAYAEHNFATP